MCIRDSFKLGSYYDNGTAGIVDTFTEEVLSETTLLTFKHIEMCIRDSS